MVDDRSSPWNLEGHPFALTPAMTTKLAAPRLSGAVEVIK
jgi:hypothetical protein